MVSSLSLIAGTAILPVLPLAQQEGERQEVTLVVVIPVTSMTGQGTNVLRLFLFKSVRYQTPILHITPFSLSLLLLRTIVLVLFHPLTVIQFRIACRLLIGPLLKQSGWPFIAILKKLGTS